MDGQSKMKAIEHRKGFTIVELLIVIVVIGILAAITVVAYNGIQQRARDSKRTSDVKSLQKVIELYRVDNGEYPLNAAGTANTGYNISAISGLLVPNYINSMPEDPTASISYQYVRGPVENDSYAIRVQYESKTDCKVGVNSASTNWWGLADC